MRAIIRMWICRHLKLISQFVLVSLIFPGYPSNAAEPEQTWLRTGQPWYLSGDDLHYAVYLFNPIPGHGSTPSRILITEFTNFDGNLISRHFHDMTERVSHGTCILSDTLETGCYWLRAYTQYQVGFTENLIHYVPVFIVNQEDLDQDDILQEKLSFVAAGDRQITAIYPEKATSTSNISVEITGIDNRTSPGNQINLKIGIFGKYTGEGSRFSLLVRNEEQFSSAIYWPGSLEEYFKRSGRTGNYIIGQNHQGLRDLNEDSLEMSAEPVYPPQTELKLRGRLIDPETGEGLGSRALALTQTGQYPGFELIFTNKEGLFEFRDLHFTNRNNQLVLNGGEMREILLDNQLIRPAFSPPMLSGDLTARESFRQYIKKRKLDLRFRKFYAGKISGTTENSIADDLARLRIYKKPDHIYRLDEYIELKDMREVIIELLPNVKIYKENDLTRIRLFSHLNAGITPDPMFLVNGRIVKDSEYILHMDNRNVRQIEVLVKETSLEPFGPMGIGGVVAIYTRNPVPVPSGLILDVEGYHEPQQKSFGTGRSDRRERNFPDFNPVIYWDPVCVPEKEGIFETSFIINDLAGKFEILVEGMTENGIPFTISEKFFVDRPAHP